MSNESGSPAILVDGLRKVYGPKVAVRDVSFTVAPGEIFGILGPNGAGKTTTVESIAGLRVGDGGRIRVAGLDPWTEHDDLVRVLGIQLQESKLQPKITVREALQLWSALFPAPTPWPELAERLGLTPQLNRRFATLSGGQQQRLSIALALISDPRIAILDELSTGLDPRARRDVWQIVRDLRERGVTVLLVTHSLEEASALCDRIAIIDDGMVRALDTPENLVRGGSAATITSFETDPAIDLELLELLERVPGVTRVRREAGRVVLEGAEDCVLAVLETLCAHRITPVGLRVAAGSLDAAYLDLTEHSDARAEALS